jgi:hypothetical protein
MTEILTDVTTWALRQRSIFRIGAVLPTKVRTDARRDAAGICLRETEVSGAQLDGLPATVKKPRNIF